MGTLRGKLNRSVLWLLDGPAWWSGPLLVAGGFVICLMAAGSSARWAAGAAPMLLIALIFMVTRPRMALLIAVAVTAVVAFNYWNEPWALLGVGLAALGTVWMISRRAQVEHYRRLARHDGKTCPVCGYDHGSSGGTICPECGTDVPEYLARVRKVMK